MNKYNTYLVGCALSVLTGLTSGAVHRATSNTSGEPTSSKVVVRSAGELVTYASSSLVEFGTWASEVFESSVSGLAAWQVGLVSILGYILVSWVVAVLSDRRPLVGRVKAEFFRLVKSIPAVRETIEAEMDKQLAGMGTGGLFDPLPEEEKHYALPAQGIPIPSVLSAAERMASKGHVDWAGGKVSGTVYHGGDEWSQFMGAISARFIWTNPLHADVFPGVRRMEAEVVAMVLDMFSGGPGTRDSGCGMMTTGGTESILMAVKAYRDRAAERGISNPNLVVADSAHCAFDKACGYFGITLLHVPVDPVTGAADVAAMGHAIDRNTIALVGSAPSYPHGVVDNIQALSDLAVAHDIGLHVDACLGGFLVAFMADAGFPLSTPFDFSLPGVSSISVDTHKYAFTPKGSSVVLFGSTSLRHYAYFVAPDWPGGVYASPSMCGSRAGASIASAWAALLANGRDGYIQSTRAIVSVTRQLADGIAEIPGLYLIGKGEVSVVAFSSNEFNIYTLSSHMSKRGWNLSALQHPAALHLAVTVPHTRDGVADDFLADLADVAATLMQNPTPPQDGMGVIYGMADAIPDRSLVSQMAHGFIDVMYRVDPSSR